MRKIRPQSLYKRPFFLMSILLPIIIMGSVYYQEGIYWGSKTTMLASDAYPQLLNFYANFRDVLVGNESIFYTWSGALGGNFWALSSYYINSLFTFIVVFFDKVDLPNALYLITLLKFGAIGGSFYLFSQKNFSVKEWVSLSISLCYALMSFSVAYSPINMWLDGLIYLPLIIWGINRVVEQKKPGLLFVSYSLLFISNYYIGFMVGVFSFLYMCVRMYCSPESKRTFPLYLGTSLLAGGASMVVILPAILDLRTNGESLSTIDRFITQDTGAWDLIAKQFIGAYDTAKFGSAPFVFVGILPLLFGLFFFFCSAITKRQKIGYGLLGLFLILSVYIYPLNLFWHGFHFPNMLLFRFSFLLSFLLCLWTLKVVEKWRSSELSSFFNVSIVVIGVFLLAYFVMNPKRYDYIRVEDVLWTLFYCVCYLTCIYFLQKIRGKGRIGIILCLLLGVSVEMTVNTRQMVKGIENDWGYPEVTKYQESYNDLQKLVNVAKEEMTTEDSFQRILNLNPVIQNESFNFGYSGLSQFSSIRNRAALSYLNRMGYRSEGTNLTVSPFNNTLIMNSFLGTEYLISQKNPLLYGYEIEDKVGNYYLYKNNYALPLGMMTDDGIYKEENTKDQSQLWNYLSDSNEEYVRLTRMDKEVATNTIITYENNSVIYSQDQAGSDMVIEWEIAVPAHSQAYLSLYGQNSAVMKDAKATITVQGQSSTYEMSKVSQYYTIGYYEEATTIPVKLTISGVSVVQLPTPDVLLLNTEKFKKSAEKIQQKGVPLAVDKNQATGSVDLKEDGVLLTTIAYDKGWRAYVDGEKTAIKPFDKGLITVPVKKGKHDIQLIYYPNGLFLGLGISVASVCLFIACCLWKKRGAKINDQK